MTESTMRPVPKNCTDSSLGGTVYLGQGPFREGDYFLLSERLARHIGSVGAADASGNVIFPRNVLVEYLGSFGGVNASGDIIVKFNIYNLSAPGCEYAEVKVVPSPLVGIYGICAMPRRRTGW